jgi:hypothetical protein
MADKLVTVAKFTNSMDAHLAQMSLEAAGIESALVGEESSNVLPLVQITSIELCVAAEKADEAVTILESEGREEVG